MLKKVLIIFFVELLFTVSVWSQDLISSENVGSISQAQLTATLGFPALNGVELYKILYTTPDVNNVIDTASGLIAFPDEEMGEYPVLVYQHGTVDGKNDVPSNLKGGYQVIAFSAGQGYIALGADYVGLGESKGFHPYVHAKTEASAALDFMRAIPEFLNTVPIDKNDQLFITGYSQGGHAAMALHKEIELYYPSEFTVTASSCMSGPYSISKAMTDKLYGDDNYFFMSYFPYALIGYQSVYGNLFTSLSDVFKAEYIPIIEGFFQDDYSVFGINEQLLNKVFAETGSFVTSSLIKEDVLEELRTNPLHPINVALADNDTYTWVPQAPIQLVYCTNDDQVPFENSIIADSFFVANGVTDITTLDVGSSLDHSQCAQPAILATYIFFQQFYNPSSIDNPSSLSEEINIYPNPANNTIQITIGGEKTVPFAYRMIDLHGKEIMSGRTNGDYINVSSLLPGLYILELNIGNRVINERLLIGN